MIVSDLNSAGRYAEADKKIAACIDRARTLNAQTKCGRYDVCQDVYVNVMEYEPKSAEDAVFETHELYADLQLILSGEEYMGYAALGDLSQKSEYDKEKDIAFWTGKAALLPLRAGEFAMFYPGEPHAPSLKKSAGKVKKAVFKIRYEKE